VQEWGHEFGPGDSFLSYLPLAHIFDRCVAVMTAAGCVAMAAALTAHGSQMTLVATSSPQPNPMRPIPNSVAEEMMIHLGASVGYWQVRCWWL